jgi:hypothetical protein
MVNTYTKLLELERELKELVADLKRFKQLWPYERQYVLRRSYEILHEKRELIGQVLTIDK